MTAATLCRRARQISALLCLALILAGPRVAVAQGADVQYVPTPSNVVDAMLAIAKVGSNDYLIDLGSGDGRIVIAAAKKFGARGFGVDIDGALVNNAQREAERQGVSGNVTFHARNLFITDISKATVLTMYLLQRINLQLRPRLFAELRPGTRIVSHDFDMGNWQPDEKLTVPVPDKPYGSPSSDVYLWIVPANAAGRWQWRLAVGGAPQDYQVTVEQTFQMLEGKPLVGGRSARFGNGRVRGEEVSFDMVADIGSRAVRHGFRGRITGDAMKGRVILHGAEPAELEWSAVRTARGKMEIDAGVPASLRRIVIAEEKK